MTVITKKEESAERLIQWHFRIEPEMVEIYRILASDEDADHEPIKLLEVNAATLETGEVMTFGFGPADDIYYSSVIAEVTPSEMERIRRGEMPLPQGWNLQTAQHYARP